MMSSDNKEIEMMGIKMWGVGVGVVVILGVTAAFLNHTTEIKSAPVVEFVHTTAPAVDVSVSSFTVDRDVITRIRDKELGNVCYYVSRDRAISCVNDISLNMVPAEIETAEAGQ